MCEEVWWYTCGARIRVALLQRLQGGRIVGGGVRMCGYGMLRDASPNTLSALGVSAQRVQKHNLISLRANLIIQTHAHIVHANACTRSHDRRHSMVIKHI